MSARSTGALLLALTLYAGAASGATGDLVAGGGPLDRVDLEPAPFNGFSFYLEEDAFNVIYKTDRNYTGGGAFRFSGAWVDRLHLTAPLDALDFFFGIDRLRDRLLEQGGRIQKGYAFLFGITAFTPRDIRSPEPIFDDRPYSALDFLTVNRTFASERRGLALTTELTLGALGLDHGHWVQATIHRLIREGRGCVEDTCSPPDPKGWPHQISNGGEPTARYAVTLEKLLSRVGTAGPGYDFKLTGKAELGYYTAASVGGALRFGLINSPFWSYNTAPLSSYTHAPTTQASESLRGEPIRWRPELYVWGGARARFVAYNALLQGQFRHSTVTFDGTRLERFVYEYEAGLTVSLAGFSIIWSAFIGRSPEFDSATARPHLWSAFTVAWDG